MQQLSRASVLSPAGIATEAVAGLLWMALEIPAYVSGEEMDGYARAILAKAGREGTLDAIEAELRNIQVHKLFGIYDTPRGRAAARRILETAQAAGPGIRFCTL